MKEIRQREPRGFGPRRGSALQRFPTYPEYLSVKVSENTTIEGREMHRKAPLWSFALMCAPGILGPLRTGYCMTCASHDCCREGLVTRSGLVDGRWQSVTEPRTLQFCSSCLGTENFDEYPEASLKLSVLDPFNSTVPPVYEFEDGTRLNPDHEPVQAASGAGRGHAAGGRRASVYNDTWDDMVHRRGMLGGRASSPGGDTRRTGPRSRHLGRTRV